MTDEKKSRILLSSAALLTVAAISYNLLHEYVMPDIEGYWQRRLYYERVISKRGLTLHKGMSFQNDNVRFYQFRNVLI